MLFTRKITTFIISYRCTYGVYRGVSGGGKTQNAKGCRAGLKTRSTKETDLEGFSTVSVSPKVEHEQAEWVVDENGQSDNNYNCNNKYLSKSSRRVL